MLAKIGCPTPFKLVQNQKVIILIIEVIIGSLLFFSVSKILKSSGQYYYKKSPSMTAFILETSRSIFSWSQVFESLLEVAKDRSDYKLKSLSGSGALVKFMINNDHLDMSLICDVTILSYRFSCVSRWSIKHALCLGLVTTSLATLCHFFESIPKFSITWPFKGRRPSYIFWL